jgi:hypothetical protein
LEDPGLIRLRELSKNRDLKARDASWPTLNGKTGSRGREPVLVSCLPPTAK